MFEIGFVEILMISALALIVLGPEKLPKVARQVGRWVGRARGMARQFREQLEEEVTVSDAAARKPAAQPTGRPQPPASSAGSSADSPTSSATVADESANATDSSVKPIGDDDPSNWYPPDHHAHSEPVNPDNAVQTGSDAPQVDWVDDRSAQSRTDRQP
ncbi:MAG: twin-arginine translocase subunit TatB [Pseudomonadales bacterium]|nr:twin-arginine translocase subunit TatB [Pseudomonadales bacterium]